MSQEICQAVFSLPALSAQAREKLALLPDIDYGELWDLVKKYGPRVIQALETVLPMLVPGAAWVSVVTQILEVLGKEMPSQ